MHESSGHGYAITRRKSSKVTGTQKLKLGKEERGKDQGAMGTRAEMVFWALGHTHLHAGAGIYSCLNISLLLSK